jgi:outer membrane murein-binding lipoprotein Lpp
VKKAAIIGLLALLALTVVVFAAPALSTSNDQQVTVKSLARQVRTLRSQVRALRSQVKSLQRKVTAAQSNASAAQTTAGSAQDTADTALSTAQKLDGCLNSVLPLSRYEDYVGSNAAFIFTDYDPDVLGYVPNVDAGSTFSFVRGLDVTNTGATPNYYVALVESSCAGGYRIAQQGAHAQ